MKPSDRNIILIGMPGAGKTTIGKLVAAQTGREFYDSDAEIETRAGGSCAEILRERGEQMFREMEREVLSELVQKRGAVISVGGGAPVSCGYLLRAYSVVVLVFRDLTEIAESLDGDSRPLARSLADLERLYAQRREVYDRLKCIAVYNSSDKDPAEVAAGVVESARRHLRARLLILNGPNLNMLGIREPEVYGETTYEDLQKLVYDASMSRNVAVLSYQSNHEGALIDEIHMAHSEFDGIVINPGAYTHYSYAIYDALQSVAPPAVEVHISDIHAREAFRRVSVVAPACIAQISGRGVDGYVEAMDLLLTQLGVDV